MTDPINREQPTFTHIQMLSAPTTAWSNGAGVTRNILDGPRDERGEISWRLSLADINTSAEYSTYLGHDRASCVVAGQGLTLCMDGVAKSAAFAEVVTYAGEQRVLAEPLGGLVRNLNVFSRRDVATADMGVHVARGPRTWPARTALVLLDGRATVAGVAVWNPLDLVLTGDTPVESVCADALVLAIAVPAGTSVVNKARRPQVNPSRGAG